MNNGRAIKIGLIIYFVSLALILVLIRNSPARGYELSIYANTPLPVWLFLIGSFMAGVIIIVHHAFSGSNSRWWLIGFLMLMTGNFIICSLSALRGYFIYNTIDPLAHGGMVKDILLSGSISANNYYPWVHIWIAQVCGITGASIMSGMRYLPALLTVLYMVSIYLLATGLLPKRGQQLLVAAASSALIFEFFHTAIYAHSLATFMLPWVFLLYFKDLKNPSVVSKVLLLLIVIAMTFSHPTTVFFVIVFLFCGEIIRFILRRRALTGVKAGQPLSSVSPANSGISFNLAIISAGMLFIWFFSFTLFQNRLRIAANVLMGRTAEIVPYQVLNLPGTLQLGLQDFLIFFFKLYSPRMIYLGLAIIAMMVVIWLVVKHKRELEGLALLVIFVPIGWIFTIVFYILTTSQSLTRIAMTDLLVLVSPILVGFLLYEIRENRHRFPKLVLNSSIMRQSLYRLSGKAGLSIILLFAIVMSIFTVYRSPYLYQSNWQATHADMCGLEWLVNHKQDNLLYNGLGLTHSLPHIYFGYDRSLELDDYEESMARVVLYGGNDIFDHFGYHLYASIGERYENDAEERPGGPTSTRKKYKFVRYMVITEAFHKALADPGLSRRRVVGNWNLGGRWNFNDQDFQMLYQDATVDKVYSSRGEDIFLLVPYKCAPDDPLFKQIEGR